MDSIRFSEYAEQCCEYLGNSPTPSDQDVLRMLRLQQIVERYENARILFSQTYREKNSAFDVQHDALTQSGPVDVMAFVDHWENELMRYWDGVPDSEKSGE